MYMQLNFTLYMDETNNLIIVILPASANKMDETVLTKYYPE